MARLNEPPLPFESIDALKRRFIRQNRDLARKNSAQSIQIRNLDAEISRLLCENLTFREENLRTKNELENTHARYALANVAGVREQLEQKLAEVAALMGDLKVAATSRPPLPAPVEKSTSRKSLKRSPNLVDFHNRVSTTEDVATGAMPTIPEDKSYPRLFEEIDVVKDLNSSTYNNSSDSPDLGPPPVAHFEGDPIKYDGPSPPKSTYSPARLFLNDKEDEDSGSKLFANLETRRRRRESGSTKVRGQETPTELPPPTLEETSAEPAKQSLKVGAKRKLSVLDDGDKQKDKKISQREDFSFRRNNSQAKTEKEQPKRKDQENTTAVRSRPGRTTSLASRRALGLKPVNTDPVLSPNKAKFSENEKPKDPEKVLVHRGKETVGNRDRKITPQTIDQPEPLEPIVTSIETSDLPPITPVPSDMDILSPESSNPPTTGNFETARDTPPPKDLDGGRASRRRGTAVSYAEPNLRDKMRRPGKELVSAITDVKLVRASSHRASSGEKIDGDGTSVSIKKEGEGSKTWNPTALDKDPASPLGAKFAAGGSSTRHLSAASLAERHRRISANARGNDDKKEGPDGLEALAALVADSKMTTSRILEVRAAPGLRSKDKDTKAQESLEVFDFRPDSPEWNPDPLKNHMRNVTLPDLSKSKGNSKNGNEAVKRNGTSKVSRRRDTLATEASVNNDTVNAADMADDGKGSLRAERAERRRSMMI